MSQSSSSSFGRSLAEDALPDRSPANYRNLLQDATVQIRRLRHQVVRLEQQQTEPIAIVGTACRFPGGANSPDAYWRLLRDGVDAVGEIPAQRWDVETFYDSDPDAAGKMYTRSGSFIDQVDQFDPHFFGISPREADQMDPQQRLLLEVSYTALENAGLPAFDMKGSATGVFVGLCFDDYAQRSVHSGDLTRINAFSSLGNTRSIAAGRIAYTFGFQGPVLQLDTTCSSSLLAVHLACQSLRNQESDLALAGGVNLMLSPEVSVGFCKLGALSVDGRCKPFDASADGYGRGEGCGIVVLKRLSDAIANRDNILALVKGSAVNHDGTSNGLTAPNGSAQTAVIKQAIANAQIDPDQIQYVEAHGTGTPLGDPIEILSLSRALREDRSEHSPPLWVGSAKSNFGHLEGAAGVAGLLKIILSLQHQQIPPNLHFLSPNPRIPWEHLPISVPTQLTPWPQTQAPRCAGLSGFGMSGTNVHLVIQAADPSDLSKGKDQGDDRSAHLLALSARSEEALRALVQHYIEWLPTTSAELADICATASARRSHFSYRLALVADSKQQLIQKLRSSSNSLASFTPAQLDRKVAFLFTGQGAQYVGMARQLYEEEPIFHQALSRCASLLERENIDLLSILYPSADSSESIHQTAYAQPALFAIAYALTQLWHSWGIYPDYVLGHSVGEYAAAVSAGVLSVEAGIRLVAARGRMMQAQPASGGMTAVIAASEEVQALLPDQVEIAAINGSLSTVISGERVALEQATAQLNQQGIKTKQLQVSHAFHSAQMEPMLPEFEQIARSVQYCSSSEAAFVSSVSGKINAESSSWDTSSWDSTWSGDWSSYWTEQIRKPVRFADAMQTLAAAGCTHFVEIGPTPTLLAMGQACLPELSAQWLPSLTAKKTKQKTEQKIEQTDSGTILSSLGKLYETGGYIDWASLNRNYPRQTVDIPNYPFQKQRYWVEAEKAAPYAALPVQKETNQRTDHPLLGRSLSLAGSARYFEAEIDSTSPFNWADHTVFDTALLPTAVYLEIALAAGKRCFESSFYIESATIHTGLRLSELVSYRLQTQVALRDSTAYEIKVYSARIDAKQAQETTWIHHFTAVLKASVAIKSSPSPMDVPPDVLLPEFQRRLSETNSARAYDAAPLYNKFSQRGIDYSASFRSLEQVWIRSSTEAIASIHPANSSSETAFLFHPVLLDAGLQLAGVTLSDTKGSYLPVAVEQFCQHSSVPKGAIWAYAQRRGSSKAFKNNIVQVNIYWINEQGQVFADMKGLTLQPIERLPIERQPTERQSIERQQAGRHPLQSQPQWLHEIVWQPARLTQQQTVLPNPKAVQQAIAPQFTRLIQQSEFLTYQSLQSELNRLASAYIQQALTTLGLNNLSASSALADPALADSALAKLSVVPQRAQLLNRCLDIQATIQSTGDDDTLDAAQQHAQLQQNYPILRTELGLLKRCGENLSAVLQGHVDPVSLLFPEGDLSELSELYQNSVGPRVMNQLVQAAVSAITSQAAGQLRDSDRPLRILELGAGTGATTAYLLPELAKLPCEIEYVFTDISPRFVSAARKQFQAFDWVRYDLLDIEEGPHRTELSGFDIVIAANVLHAAADLRSSLSHVGKRLSPGGQLILLEGTQPVAWVDLIFGLTPGWWRFTDKTLRPQHPLIPVNSWKRVLASAGFEASAEMLPEISPEIASETASRTASKEDSAAEIERAQSVIIAQWKERTQAQWAVMGADAESVVSLLKEYGQKAEAISAKTISAETISTGEIANGDIVYDRYVCSFANGDANEGVVAQKAVADTAIALYTRTLKLIQFAALKDSAPRLYFTSVAPDLKTQLVHSGLWGLLQTAQLEHPNLRCTYIQTESTEQLTEELLASSPDTQVIYQNGQRKVAQIEDFLRVEPASLESAGLESTGLESTGSDSTGSDSTGSDSTDLSSQCLTYTTGTLSSLRWQPVSRRQLGANEVEIKVGATGLNFRDVLVAMGEYPEAAPLGCECAGEVVAVGTQVSDVEIGQQVMAIAPGSFAQYVTIDRALLVPIPKTTTPVAAATLPVAFTTAYYSLRQLAQLKAGETVLIHAATGGVGQAAVQIAQQIGAEIFATASPGKWDTLRALGITHIMNSRDLSFAEEIMAATEGKGVDVVLNSLPGEFRTKSLESLSKSGRFIEIGKGDGLNVEQSGHAHPKIDHHVVDISKLCVRRPKQIQSILCHLKTEIEQKSWQTIPFTAFAQADTIQAFRTLQRAKHTGKIVLKQNALVLDTGLSLTPPISASSTYLVTGGLGGLGLLVAQWLADKGAKQIALLSRSKADSAARVIDQLESQGVGVKVILADVSDRAAVASAVADLSANSQHPLKGIVHAAGVLDDGLIQQLTEKQLKTVLAPKVEGAWNLHTLTQGCELDFFVLFSSAAALLGSPGQANHAAANAFLDGLARYRQQQGLPALSIDWGAWSSVGSALKYQQQGRLEQFPGVDAIAPEEGIAQLEKIWSTAAAQVGIVPISWQTFLSVPAARNHPLLQGKATALDRPAIDAGGTSRAASSFLAELNNAPADQKREKLDDYVCEQIYQVLGSSKDDLDRQIGFFDLGIDSLTALELKNSLQTDLGLSLPSTLIFDYPTVEALLDYLAERLIPAPAAAKADAAEDTFSDLPADDLIAKMDQKLSDLDSLFKNLEDGEAAPL